MPVPLLIPLAVAGATGVVAGGKGLVDLGRARNVMKISEERHAEAVAGFEERRAKAQAHLEEFGLYQLSVQQGVMADFVGWLEANERKVRQIGRPSVDGVEATIDMLPEMREQVLRATSLIGPAVSAVATGVVARSAALAGVSALASASTGTAISTLSGAAASNATLAYLGGGSIASGGGGMAAGATVLSGVAIAPGMLIAGISLGIKGQKAKTKAAAMDARVDVSIARLKLVAAQLDAIEDRADELRTVLGGVSDRATLSLVRLASVDFDPEIHAELFLETAHLIRALSDLLSTPLLDTDGSLTDVSVQIIERYRTS